MELKLEKYLAEFIGTFFLAFTVGLNVLQNTALAPVSIGSILMVMVFASGSVSGAHFNPAVTVGAVIGQYRERPTEVEKRDRIHSMDLCVYIVSQCAAAFLASLMVYWVLGATFTFQPGTGYGVAAAGFAELLFTTALVYVVLNTASTKESKGNDYYGLAIGFTLMSAAFAIGPVSGCCLNPALAFGVMLTNYMHTGAGMDYFLLYLFVPFGGALLASGIFRLVRYAEFQKEDDIEEKGDGYGRFGPVSGGQRVAGASRPVGNAPGMM